MFAKANGNAIYTATEPRNLCNKKPFRLLKYYHSFFSRIIYCMSNVLRLVFGVLKRTAKIKGGKERQVLELTSFLA
jgi:hypothetical protein